MEKLGRLQSMNSRVELKEISPRRINYPRTYSLTGRGTFQVSVFNPLPVNHSGIFFMKAYTSGIKMYKVPNSSHLNRDIATFEPVLFTVIKV